jgi:UDP-4-amino-4,6-dideoxy-N-acetyl-beta-L-altrosamine N-acetyltransferase
VILGNNVTLLPFDEKWLGLVHKWINQPEVRSGTGSEGPVSDYEHQRWYKRLMLDSSQRVYLIGQGRGEQAAPVGLVGLKEIEGRSRSAEYWIYIGNLAVWRKGVAGEATRMILDYAFNVLNLHRIFLRVHATNCAAVALYHKLGFVFEGSLRDATFNDGKFVDVICYSLLEDEFRNGWRK